MSGELTEQQQRDRDRYHPADPADYGSAIGIPYEDDNGRVCFACVGCSYCMGDESASSPSQENGGAR